MRNTKKTFIIFTLMLCVILITSCQSQSTEEPMIKIISGSNELKTIYYGDRYNKEKDDIQKRLKDFMVGKRFSDMPYVSFGDEIDIETLNTETKEFQVYDYVMDGNANIVSNFDTLPFDTVSNEDGNAKYTFVATQDYKTFIDYAEDGKLIHCLLIRYKIKNQSFAFATIVLSNKK